MWLVAQSFFLLVCGPLLYLHWSRTLTACESLALAFDWRRWKEGTSPAVSTFLVPESLLHSLNFKGTRRGHFLSITGPLPGELKDEGRKRGEVAPFHIYSSSGKPSWEEVWMCHPGTPMASPPTAAFCSAAAVVCNCPSGKPCGVANVCPAMKSYIVDWLAGIQTSCVTMTDIFWKLV